MGNDGVSKGITRSTWTCPELQSASESLEPVFYSSQDRSCQTAQGKVTKKSGAELTCPF